MTRVSAARGFALTVLASIISSACGEMRASEASAERALPGVEARRVTAAVVKPTRALLRLTMTNTVLVTTPDHPFAKLDEGWVPAGALSAGDTLVSSAAPGGTVRVITIERLELREPIPVYNLTVARTHAYFVGTDAVLVHNVDCTNPEPSRGPTLERSNAIRRQPEERRGPTLERSNAIRRQPGEPFLPEQPRPPREIPDKYQERLRELERKSQLAAAHQSLRERERERERKRQEEEQRARERREYEEQVRRLLEERRLAALTAERQRRRLVLNDTPGRLGRNNCGYCTLAGLTDVDKLSTFVRETRADERVLLKPTGIVNALRELGLIGDLTPKPRQFKNSELRDLLPGDPPSPNELRLRNERLAEHEAKRVMRESSANTFAVAYYFNKRVESPPGSGHFEIERRGHALTAVRRDDGSIFFVDLQSKPPTVHESLPDEAWGATVIPTDVDWRFNRQLYAAVRDAPISPP